MATFRPTGRPESEERQMHRGSNSDQIRSGYPCRATTIAGPTPIRGLSASYCVERFRGRPGFKQTGGEPTAGGCGPSGRCRLLARHVHQDMLVPASPSPASLSTFRDKFPFSRTVLPVCPNRFTKATCHVTGPGRTGGRLHAGIGVGIAEFQPNWHMRVVLLIISGV